MKRIAIISDSFPPHPCGGIATSQYNLYRSLLANGYDVNVYTYLDYEIKEEKDLRIHRYGASGYTKKLAYIKKVIHHKITKWFYPQTSSPGVAYQVNIIKASFPGAKKINRELKKFNPDILFIPDFGTPLYSIDKQFGCKIIYTSHHNPLRFINNPLLPLHSAEDANKAIEYEKKSLYKADLVICPSQYMKQVFIETFNLTLPILVIPNMIDIVLIQSIERKDLHSILGLDSNAPIIYIPSAQSRIKGGQFVIEIIRRLSILLNYNVGFYLSGGLSDDQSYELAQFRPHHIYAPGNVDYESNIALIKDCKICISPTLLESFGMAILESAFCDLPSVCFDAGGNRDLIINGETGYIVPYLDVEKLIFCTFQLLSNPELYQTCVHKLQKQRQQFATDNLIKKYHNIIESTNYNP